MADIRVAALYRFTAFEDAAALQAPLLAVCKANGVKGTLLLAPEGINGTVAGPSEGIEAVLAHIRALPGCAELDVKFSHANAMPFHRTKVRLKREIVTMGVEGIDPRREVGSYVAPADWNALIADPDTVLIDTRNDYEVAIGTFDGAVDPHTQSFRDFPAWFRDHREELLSGKKKVAMFCTGGIRCEKSTAFLKAEGVDQVYHLEGGILRYLEEIAPEDSRWQGECFVFDERVSVGHGLDLGSHTLCRACRMPVSEADRASDHFEEGVACPHCFDARTDEQRANYAERHRQTALAERRGVAHIGAVLEDQGATSCKPTNDNFRNEG